MLPAHIAKSIHGERAALLPPTPTLRWPVPDTLGGTQLVHRPQDRRADGMQCAAQTKTPLRVEIAAGVNNDVDFPRAAHLGQPALRGFLGGVGDGNAVDLFLFL